MDNLTILIPFFNGRPTIQRLLDSLPKSLPVIIVDDFSDVRLGDKELPGAKVARPTQRAYFAGAVNVGLNQCATDVLIVNQDAYFTGTGWLDLLEQGREHYGLIGERVRGHRPAFPLSYVDGSFMFIRRDVISKIGPMNAELYPLWGSTCEYQLRACRAGFKALPVQQIPDFHHRPERPTRFGQAMDKAIRREPERESDFTRVPPEISVVIPCYNYGRYLPEAIESLMAQTFQSFEVIIVDDASTDDSLEIAQSLADPWKAVRVIHLTNNLGTAGAVNAGIREAHGKYIARLDADDMMRPDRLSDMWKLGQQNPHSFIFDDLIFFGSEMDKIPGAVKEGGEWVYHLPEYDFERLIHKNGVHAGIFFPKEAWTETGGYPVDFRDGRDDWAFNVTLGLKGWCGVKASKPGYLYRRDGQNRTLTNTRPADYEMFREKMVKCFPDVYRGVRPMACCGSGNGNVVRSGGSQMAMAAASSNGSGSLPGQAGFEILEYIGAGTSDSSWFGPVTKTRYVFGGNRRVGYVDIKDAPGMVAMADGGRRVFRVYVKPPTPEVEIVEETPVLEMAGVKEAQTFGAATTTTGDAVAVEPTYIKEKATTPPTAESPSALRQAQDATLPEEKSKTVTKAKRKPRRK